MCIGGKGRGVTSCLFGPSRHTCPGQLSSLVSLPASQLSAPHRTQQWSDEIGSDALRSRKRPGTIMHQTSPPHRTRAQRAMTSVDAPCKSVGPWAWRKARRLSALSYVEEALKIADRTHLHASAMERSAIFSMKTSISAPAQRADCGTRADPLLCGGGMAGASHHAKQVLGPSSPSPLASGAWTASAEQLGRSM